jgi:hypothetical protein
VRKNVLKWLKKTRSGKKSGATIFFFFFEREGERERMGENAMRGDEI